MKFNLNDKVCVRLTDFGRQILRREFEAHQAAFPSVFGKFNLPKEVNGWSEWQLWHLMNTFGEHIGIGQEAPFDLTIEIPERK